MVDVAQLVEPRIVIPVVAGSIPVVHPINSSDKSMADSLYFYKYCYQPLIWYASEPVPSQLSLDKGPSR